jgi:hypothetical protein
MDAYDQDAEPDEVDLRDPAPSDRPPADPRRLITLALATALIIASIVAVAAVQPWRYLVDEEGVEPFAGTRTPPEAVQASLRDAAETDREGRDPLDQPEVAESARGVFSGRDGHTVDGQARIVDLADGRRVLRIEGLSVDNGPGLAVYLSPAPGDALTGEFIDGAVSLGELVYNRGDSTYEIPPEIDPDAYRSAVIWSDPTGVNFAVAGFR